MTIHIWRTEGLSLDTQWTPRWTTATAAKFKIPFTNVSFQEKNEKERDEWATWNIAQLQDAITTKSYSEWEIAFNMDLFNMIPFLSALTGSNYKDLPAWDDNWNWTYTHTFPLLENAEHTALTVWQDDPNIGTKLFDLVMLSTLWIEFNAGWLTKVTSNVMWKAGVAWTAQTLNCNSWTLIKAKAWYVKLGDANDLSTLGTPLNLLNATLNFEKNLDLQYVADGNPDELSPKDINNQHFIAKLDLEIMYDDSDLYNLYKSNLNKSAEVWFVWKDNENLVFDFNNITFTEYSKNLQLDWKVTQKVSAEMIVKCNANYFITKLTNHIEDLSSI